MSAPNRIPYFVGLTLLGGCGGVDDARAPSAVVLDSAGIQIVTAAVPPEHHPLGTTVATEPDLEIGEMSGDPPYLFEGIVGVLSFESGVTVVCNGGDRTLRLYDERGGFIDALGGRGDGPTELRLLNACFAVGEEIYAYQAPFQPIKVYGVEGTFRRSILMPRPGGRAALLSDIFPDGSLLLRQDGPRSELQEGASTRSVRLIVAGPTSGDVELDTILTTVGDRWMRHGSLAFPMAFTPTFAATAVDDLVVTSWPERFDLGVMTRSGDLVRLIRSSRAPAPATSAHRRAFEERILFGPMPAGDTPYQSEEVRQRIVEMMQYPDSLPVHYRVLVDATGLIWLERGDAPRDPLPQVAEVYPDATIWDVFSVEGGWLASVELPPRFDPLEIGYEHVAGVHHDDFGVETVRLYRLERETRSEAMVGSLSRASGVMAATVAATSMFTLASAELDAQEGTKRALIISIGEYGSAPVHPVTGDSLKPYRNLNANNDIPLVRGALEHHGFDEIDVLQNADADIDGIREALRRLVRDTNRGDVVVLHYSGHGHRISNDNPAEDVEVDGYDEVIVPYGAHEEFYDGYEGELHIRDDELGTIVAQLRQRAGPTGSVTFFLDACYSGTATRGDADLPARGTRTPMGEAVGARVTTRGGAEDLDGTGLDVVAPPGTRGRGNEGLAAFALFSAASQRQVAYETFDIDGETKVGSLSYALARALPRAQPGTTNRALFAQITRSLNGKVNQTPQLEGAEDALLFSNKLRQQLPYVAVDSVASSVRLGGGSLVGINPGTHLLVHEIGAQRPDPETAIAEVRVTEAGSTMSLAEVVSGSIADADVGAWAFVTKRAYGDLALRVRLDASLSENDRRGLTDRYTEMGIIELVEEGADVVVVDRDGDPVARTTDDDIELGIDGFEVVNLVEEYARNRYLRRVSFDAEDLDVELDFAPVEITYDGRGRATSCAAADWEAVDRAKSLGAAQWALKVNDGYRMRVRNVGERRAFITVIDLMPTGKIDVIIPPEDDTPAEWELTANGPWTSLGCYRVSEQRGTQMLKLFATRQAQNFRAMFESPESRVSRGGLEELEAALASTYTSVRAKDVAVPTGAATTRSIIIRIDPNQE